MLRSLFNKRYIFYGGSIIISRGLEYFVLFFAAHFLTKEAYGELEYYKKFVEVGSNVLAFGFPALILSYTKSKDSKIYFYLLSILFVLSFGLILSLIGLYSSIWFLLILSMVFYALFFSGGITQSFQLVKLGSNYASIYKIVISILFYGGVFGFVYYFNVGGKAYLYPSLFLLPLALLYAFYEINKEHLQLFKIKRYWRLFRKLLISSFTLVVSNFANFMFLYTDVFVIKILSQTANNEIADFSFALNVAGMLLIISMTLVQVDIEKLKSESKTFFILNKKIAFSTILMSIFLILFYYILIQSFYTNFSQTFILFLVILTGKICSSMANLYGTYLIILKKFRLNLNVNLLFLILNIFVSWVAYLLFGLIGLAVGSSTMLITRSAIFYFYSIKNIKHQ
ncbi:MAG: oligosaccharide flippase family protein [Moheibacter sp.]